jgi:hypothetical protein
MPCLVAVKGRFALPVFGRVVVAMTVAVFVAGGFASGAGASV